jgi:hypothetical protein
MYKPPRDEVNRFCNVYIDESSQTKHRYLVIGALVIPISHDLLFDSDIIAARSGSVTPSQGDDRRPRVMKWQKVNEYNFNVYQKIIDLVFNFKTKHNLSSLKEMGLHCVVVDTSIKSLSMSGDGDFEVGFDKEFNFLCTAILPRRYRTEIFALYPDRRDARRPLDEARDIMNRSTYKWGDRRRGLLRVLKFEDPEQFEALQIVDILIGALAYRLNGHYAAPKGNRAKKALCDYIWQRYKLPDPFKTSPFQQRRFFTWLHRPEPPGTLRSGPQNTR